MEINIGMSECHKNVDNYYGSTITVWIPRCAGREAFDGVEPLPEFSFVSLGACNNLIYPKEPKKSPNSVHGRRNKVTVFVQTKTSEMKVGFF